MWEPHPSRPRPYRSPAYSTIAVIRWRIMPDTAENPENCFFSTGRQRCWENERGRPYSANIGPKSRGDIYIGVPFWMKPWETRQSSLLHRDFAKVWIPHFYRAMHLRGLGIACRPSVCLSVTLVDCDHIGWKSWKLITRTTSPTPSLFVAKRRSTSSQGNMGKFVGD